MSVDSANESDAVREAKQWLWDHSAAAPIRWELVRELVTENEQLQAQLEIRVRAALLLAHQLAEAAQVNQSLQPVRVTTVEELDALPADSVVMTISSRITYQRARTPRGDWYSSALSVCRTNVIGLPALVLWTPPDHITEQLQEVTRA